MKRSRFVAAGVASLLVPRASAFADDRMRVLWLGRGDDEVRVPFTRDGAFVYLAGFDALCWLLRDDSAPPDMGYVAMSIDLLQTLWEMQQQLEGRQIHVERGFCCARPRDEVVNLGAQHTAGLAIDAHFSLDDRKRLLHAGYLREEDFVGGHAHVVALKDRWQRSRVD